MTEKVRILIELIARLRIARISDDTIAERIGLSRAGLYRITSTPEYKAKQAEVLQDVVGHTDDILKTRADYLAQEWAKQAVPAAMQGLVDVVRQRRDLRACIAASKEILNRDPNQTLPDMGARSQGAPRGPILDASPLPPAIFNYVAKQVKQITAVEASHEGSNGGNGNSSTALPSEEPAPSTEDGEVRLDA